MAIAGRANPAEPLVAHSDHGSQYTAWGYSQRLHAAGIVSSRGRTGTAALHPRDKLLDVRHLPASFGSWADHDSHTQRKEARDRRHCSSRDRAALP